VEFNRELWGSLPIAVRRFRHGCFGIGYEIDDARPEYARSSGILRVDPPKLECFSVAKPVAKGLARRFVPKILQLNLTSFDRSQAYLGTSAVCEVPATIAPAPRHMSSPIAKILDKLGLARLFSRKCAQLNLTSYTRSVTGTERNISQEECHGLFLRHTPMLNSALVRMREFWRANEQFAAWPAPRPCPRRGTLAEP
jgi:hypothetical protein